MPNDSQIVHLLTVSSLALFDRIPAEVTAGVMAGAVVLSSLAAFTLTIVKIWQGIRSLHPPRDSGFVVRPTPEEIQRIEREMLDYGDREKARRGLERLLQEELNTLSNLSPIKSNQPQSASRLHCHGPGVAFWGIAAVVPMVFWIAWNVFYWLWAVLYSWLTFGG